MSKDRGKPVHLTNGERRLLLALVRREMERLGALGAPTMLHKEEEHLRKLRLRQYRRLSLEIGLARPTGEATG